jgi:hypothetical protein
MEQHPRSQTKWSSTEIEYSKPKEEVQQQAEAQPMNDIEKQAKVTCFNCAEWGSAVQIARHPSYVSSTRLPTMWERIVQRCKNHWN